MTFALTAHAIPSKLSDRPPMEDVVQILKLPAGDRYHQLTEQPDSVYDSLISVANDSDRTMNLRWRALTSAAALRREKAEPDLLKAAKAPEWFMRNAALVSLNEFVPAQSVALARRLVTDPALVVRSAAVEVLARNGGPNERALLWKEMGADYNRRGGQSLWIREQIVRALAEKPDHAELPLFSSLLKEKNEAIQKASMHGLERITGLKMGEAKTPHNRQVRLWQNYFNPPSSVLR